MRIEVVGMRVMDTRGVCSSSGSGSEIFKYVNINVLVEYIIGINVN